MQGMFLNCLISAIIGAVSAAGTVWYLSEHSTSEGDSQENAEIVPRELEVENLVVRDSILVLDPQTQTPSLELKSGTIVAQENLYAKNIGAFRVLGQKLQTTPDNPLDLGSPVFGELAINEDGGAFIDLLSPRESHSVTLGFDKNEKGCILSKNNDDNSIVAQAIFLKPSVEDAEQSNSKSQITESIDATPAEQTVDSVSETSVAQSPANSQIE